MTIPAGARLRAAVAEERPLQVVGAINAYCALLAQRAGFRALYLSGAGVANASFGLPDLGITSLNDVCEDVRRISGATELPLLVDADTGWGAAFNIARTTRELSRAGAGGMHLEDQVQAKRCGHRPGKALVGPRRWSTASRRPSTAATDDSLRHHGAHRRARRRRAGRRDRTRPALRRGRRRHDLRRGARDARRVPPVHRGGAKCRCSRTSPSSARRRCSPCTSSPVGRRPARAVSAVGVPRDEPRGRSGLRHDPLATARRRAVVERMQTRAELYDVLGYHEYERKLDDLFGKASLQS